MKIEKKQIIIQKHQFHLVNPSILPFLMSISLLLLTTSIVAYFHTSMMEATFSLQIAVISVLAVIIIWLLEVINEGAKYHTENVRFGLKFGFILFLISEIMFFFALFWAYFHVALSSNIDIGFIWPPTGIKTVGLWGLPFVNTILLLTSGAFLTSAHHYLIKTMDDKTSVWYQREYKQVIICLGVSIILGVIFLMCQGIEYKFGLHFSWNSIYGTVFIMLTGFHGLHVFLGTIALLFNWLRMVIILFIRNKRSIKISFASYGYDNVFYKAIDKQISKLILRLLLIYKTQLQIWKSMTIKEVFFLHIHLLSNAFNNIRISIQRKIDSKKIWLKLMRSLYKLRGIIFTFSFSKLWNKLFGKKA